MQGSLSAVGDYLIVLFVAIAVTGASVVPLTKLARRVGAVATPSDRTVHKKPTPYLGGGALMLGLLAAVGTASFLDEFEPIFADPGNIVGVLAAAGAIWIVGLIDDIKEMSAPAKLVGMIVSGSILTVVGMTIIYFRIPFVGFTVLPPDMSALVTVVWVVGMANAVNLIDGLDGLAAGIVGIAAGAFFLYSWELMDSGILDPSNLGPLIAIITVGICVGFLPFNFNPASIFMGDSGALLLGLLLAASTIAVGGQSDDPFSGQAWFFFAPLVIPLVILGVPLLDVIFAVIRRATKRTGVATADKAHLHHRLMDLGHGHRRVVIIMWGWTAILSGFVLIPVITGEGDSIVPIGIAAAALALFTIFAPRYGKPVADFDERNGASEPDEAANSSSTASTPDDAADSHGGDRARSHSRGVDP